MSAVSSPASTSGSSMVIMMRACESPTTAMCGTSASLRPKVHGRSGSASPGAVHRAYFG
jgi:hypothetical protein